MRINVSGNSFELELSVAFESDGTTKRGLLRNLATGWRLLHVGTNNTEWIGARKLDFHKAVTRALEALERECSKESLAAHEAARAVAKLRRNA